MTKQKSTSVVRDVEHVLPREPELCGETPPTKRLSWAMASLQKLKSFSLKSWEFRDTEVEDRDRKTMFDVFYGKMREVCAGAF